MIARQICFDDQLLNDNRLHEPFIRTSKLNRKGGTLWPDGNNQFEDGIRPTWRHYDLDTFLMSPGSFLSPF